MSELAAVDPSDLDGLRAALARADPGARFAPVGLRRLEIGAGAFARLPGIAAEVGAASPVVVLGDATPIPRRGAELKAAAREALAAAFDRVEAVTLDEDGGQLHADEATLEEARGRLAHAGAVVVVGSGTITDVAKASAPPDVPLVAVQTAASVNGYADQVSVLLREGAKRTVPTRFPDALLIDLETLAEAPAALTASGVGDAISLWTGPADWYLSDALGFDAGYHPAPIELIAGDGARLLGAGPAVRAGDLDALALLARVLSLGGIAIGLTGTTACVSGVEHLVSHLLDMAAGQEHRPTALHGAQVGVATIVAAAIWEHVLDELDPSAIDPDDCFPAREEVEAAVRAAWAGVDATGRLTEECWRDCAVKLERWQGCRPALEAFLADWPRHRERLRALTRPPERIATALRDAGAPTRFSELDPPAAPDVASWAVRNCHLMRNRLTVVDLLFFAGRWDDAAAERVLQRAAAVGGGV